MYVENETPFPKYRTGPIIFYTKPRVKSKCHFLAPFEGEIVQVQINVHFINSKVIRTN